MQKYNSPTDMGLNAAKLGIVDDKKVREAGLTEIKSRLKSFKQSKNKKAVRRIKNIFRVQISTRNDLEKLWLW